MHTTEIELIFKALNSDPEKGLNNEKVKTARLYHGYNTLAGKGQKSLFSMILDQFNDFMIIILIIAAIISIALGDNLEGIVILGIVLLNAVLGTYQENKASNALEALKKMASPRAKVIREGAKESIPASELVPGDLVIMETGDFVPADVRLIESNNLKIDESSLTGESVAVLKDAEMLAERGTVLGDRLNCAYSSTIVVYGRGRGIVTATGMKTEIGRIAAMIEETEDEETPLQKKLSEFGRLLGFICIFISIVIFALGIIRGDNIFDIFMIAVSLAVAAIPEGLPAVVTVILAIGMQRMVKRNAILKQLSAVETLGSTSTICTDKTGTLTQNKMTVLTVFNGSDEWKVTGKGYSFSGELKASSNADSSDLRPMMLTAVLCNDAEIVQEEVIGDPTEGALIALGAKAGFDKSEINMRYPRIKELPFDSERKLMSTLHNIEGKYTLLTKGAADNIIALSSHVFIKGSIEPLTDEIRQIYNKKHDQYAHNAMRVLGYAYKHVEKESSLQDEERNLVLAGISGMIDPPREEAKPAVDLCKKAGIRVVLITGDHVATASAIARKIGILDEGLKAIEGAKIDTYSDEEFRRIAGETNVFARVSPAHKVKIVSAIKANSDIVAMTGDGVNDAPALKKADIGIAMGITGTDVSKEASDMILTDDNFASIVDAVREGRVIYSNIRKFVGFLLSCNLGEILLIFIAILIRWPVPLLPIQLLWVNLITDSFPAFALGMEKEEEGIMKQKPRQKDEPILNKRMRVSMLFQSMGLAFASLASFRIGLNFYCAGEDTLMLARTMCFTTIIAGEMLRAYSSRSENKSIFQKNLFDNSFLNISVAGALAILFLVIYTPFLSKIFSTTALNPGQLAIALSLGIIPAVFSEISKRIRINNIDK